MAFFTMGKKNSELDEYDNDGYYEETAPVTPVAPPPAAREKTSGLSLDGKDGGNLELKLARPASFSEVTGIADYLIAGCTVFLNLEATKPDVARRILDFLTGVAYAGGGQMQKVSASTFIISPNNVDVSEPSQLN